MLASPKCPVARPSATGSRLARFVRGLILSSAFVLMAGSAVAETPPAAPSTAPDAEWSNVAARLEEKLTTMSRALSNATNSATESASSAALSRGFAALVARQDEPRRRMMTVSVPASRKR